MSDYRAFTKCNVNRLAAESGSIPFLGTNNQVYCDLLGQEPSILRPTRSEASIDQITKWCVTEIFSAALPPAKAPKL